MAAASSNQSTPFFGCKISLISKSEIRYEGILYTIDPKESTIALAKVRSFGSEDRPVERPVPPRDDIFEFIIFRASDIKDLIVDDPPPAPQLTDPAIIQAQSTSTSFPSSFPQGSISQASAVPSGPAPVSASGQAPKPSIPQLQPANQQQSKGHQQAKLQQQQHQHQQSGGDSHTTDGINKQQPKQSLASNVAGAPGYSKVLAGMSSSAASTSQQPKQQQQQSNQRGQQQSSQQQQHIQLPFKQQQQGPRSGDQQQRGERSAQMMGGGGGGGGRDGRDGGGNQNGYINRGPNRLNRQTFGSDAQNSNYHQRNGGHGGPQHPQQQGSFRPFNQQQRSGGFVPRGGLNQGGGGGGGFRRGGYNNAGQRQFGQRGPLHLNNQHHRDGPNAPKFTPLPEGEFDFEKAESDFKILEEKLMALKLNGAGGDSAAEGADSTDVIVPGIPVSAISVEALEAENIPEEPCYNKVKSFFDSISCEALEREKGTNQRVDWKAERKVNRETFGMVSARRPTFFRVGNRGGGGYQAHRGGYQAHRTGGYQNRNYGQRSGGDGRPPQRTPNASNNNNVSSTTNGGGNQQTLRQTPAKSPNAPNAGASPAVVTAAAIVAKN